MTDKRSVTLLDTVEAITDGKPVDWNSAMSNHPEISPLLESLRDIESLMRTFDTASATEQQTRAPAVADEHLMKWGHLRDLRFIGEGNFGKVYRAFDPMLERDVALKLWRKNVDGMELDISHMLSEAKRLARVHHPNVLVIHGADRHDGRAGMWTDYLSGETLEARLEKHGVVSAREAITVGIELCGALAAMHTAGLMHRDVKTFNVMRTDKGEIVLMDFGSVGELSKSGLLKTSTIRGTPLTMSPEHVRDESIGPTADLYSLGVLLYHLVTGKYPVEARNFEELCFKHVQGDTVPLIDRRPELPSAFVRVVEKAMATDPSERYPSAGAMGKALAAALAEPAPEPEPLRTPSAPDADRKDWWLRLGAAWTWLVARPARRAVAMGALVVVAAGVYVVMNPDPLNVGLDVNPVPPPQPVPTPLVQPQPVAFAVEAKLYRETLDGDERLVPGARVAPGDALWLEIEGNRAMHVYVFNEDEEGAAFALFPNARYAKKNPLEPGEGHRLPGSVDGKAYNWSVTSAGGRETFVVVASTEAQQDLDQLITDLRQTRPTRRGAGDIVPSMRSLQPVLDKLPQAAADPWVWRIDLENPMP